jgi:hypothetical protein
MVGRLPSIFCFPSTSRHGYAGQAEAQALTLLSLLTSMRYNVDRDMSKARHLFDIVTGSLVYEELVKDSRFRN